MLTPLYKDMGVPVETKQNENAIDITMWIYLVQISLC